MRILFVVLFSANLGFYLWAELVHMSAGSSPIPKVLPNSPSPLVLSHEQVPVSSGIPTVELNESEATLSEESLTVASNHLDDILSESDSVGASSDDQVEIPTGGAQVVGSSVSEETLAPPRKDFCFALPADLTNEDIQPFQEKFRSPQWQWVIKEEARDVENGFWVYVPKSNTLKEAQEKAAILKKNKFKDYYIITGGKNRYAISLGLFRVQESADGRKKMIESYGINARLEKRNTRVIFVSGYIRALQLVMKPDAPDGWLEMECPKQS